jgi:hypothetical protein
MFSFGHAKFTLEFKGDKDVEDPVKMSLSFFGPDINRMKRPPNNFLPNQKNWRVDGEYLI